MVLFGYIMVMRLSLATFLTPLMRVNRAESSVVFSLFVLVIFFLCVGSSNQKTRSVEY